MRRRVGGFTQREHLRGLVARGKRPASALRGPSCPESMRYLVQWAHELHGRSGFGSVGVVPLTYPVIESWARLTRRTVQPWDVDALLALDAVLCAPGDADAEETA